MSPDGEQRAGQPSSVEHRARQAATRHAQPRREAAPTPRRRLIRDGLLLGVLLIASAVLIPFADVANPTYAEGRAIADRLDAAYASVWRFGNAVPDAATSANLHLEAYPMTDGRTVWVLTVPTPSESSGFCYGLRFGGGRPTDAVRFRATNGCVPLGRSAFETTGTWTDVLGTERVTSPWFVPALVILVGALIAVTTDAAVTLITSRGR
jgi:hypothetical protein